MSATITRAEYDRLLLADEPLPNAEYLIEPNGKRRPLFLTPGQTVARTNPRIQASNIRAALILLTDLTEAERLGADPAQIGWQMPLGHLIESGEAFQVEHDEKLGCLTGAALTQLERWLKTKEAGKKEYKGKLFREKAEACVALLRKHGF
jgi:hypothetical protein